MKDVLAELRAPRSDTFERFLRARHGEALEAWRIDADELGTRPMPAPLRRAYELVGRVPTVTCTSFRRRSSSSSTGG